jgi:hypothetical protein
LEAAHARIDGSQVLACNDYRLSRGRKRLWVGMIIEMRRSAGNFADLHDDADPNEVIVT